MSRFHIPLRLFAAFLLGWLFAFFLSFPNVSEFLNSLVASLDPFAFILAISILFPFGLGIVFPIVSMDRRNKEFFLLALLSGPLVIAGWCLYYLPQAMREDAACSPNASAFRCGTLFGGTFFLEAFWITSTLFVLWSSLITSPIIHSIRKHRRKESSTSDFL